MKDYRNGWDNILSSAPGSPELSADLEWVLQSGQGDPGLVAEELLHTFYPAVYRLCLTLENEPQRAQALLTQIFAKAVNQAYRYRPQTGIPVWFYHCLLQALPRTTQIENRAHWPVLLHALADLSAEQISTLLNRDASRVQARLAKLDNQPSLVLEWAGLPAEKTTGLPAAPSWRQMLWQRYPVPAPDEEEVERFATEIVELAEKRRVIRRRWILAQEMILLLLVALVVGVLISAADRLAPTGPSTPRTPPPTMLVTRIVEKVKVPVVVVVSTATPGLTPYPTPSPIGPPLRLPPLSVDSSPISVLERLRIASMFWETVWADTITLLYGPPGYLGPDRIQRSQFWLSEAQARIQSGPLGKPPDELWVGYRGQLYVIPSEENSARLPEPSFRGMLKRPSLRGLGLLFNPLQPMRDRPIEARDRQIRITGRGRIAGREALVIELLDPGGARSARLWLDTQTSFVLRHQQFRPGDTRNPAIETIVLRIVFDLDFTNQSLFDLENARMGDFANDPLGNPSQALPTINARANWESNPQPAYIDPPQGFDPAQSHLTLLYPPDFDLHSHEVQVDLFGNDYFLGSATFVNPWWMICERSPDGRRIAATSRPALSWQVSPSLHWLDLTDSRVRTPRTIQIANASDLAFAPDSQRLAVVGDRVNENGLYLVDLETGELRLLAPLYQAYSLAWSPDGNQIALIGTHLGVSALEELIVLDASSGEVIYSTPYNAGDPLPNDAPLLGWGDVFLQAFPTRTAGLEGCVEP